MAEEATVDAFNEKAKTILDWRAKKDSLIERDHWGDYSFGDSEARIDRILKVTDDFSSLPIDLMDERNLASLNSHLDAVAGIFGRIDQLTTGDVVNNQAGIAQEISGQHDAMLNIYRVEVAWLAIYSGRVQHWLAGARDEYRAIQEIKSDVERERDLATDAVKVAREKAGAAGAAEFTAAFRDQATSAAESSIRWLWATAVAFGLAAIGTITFVTLHALGIPAAPTGPEEVLVYLAWRLGTVGILLGASVWCGRHYRAHRHNHEVNQHREACLENMQAFQRAVEDQSVKDMVVLEFSRAAAQGMPTGFISGRAEARGDSSPQVFSLATRPGREA